MRTLMAPDPGDRYASAEIAFGALRGRPISERTAPPPEEGSSPRFSRIRLALSAVVVLLVASILFAVLSRDDREEAGPEPEAPPVASGTSFPTAAKPEPEPDRPVTPEPPVAVTVEGVDLITDPPGATVSVDGEAKGRSDRKGRWRADLTAGLSHEISVDHPDCERPEVRTVLLKPGQRQRLEIELARKSGTVLFVKGPAGAAVEATREGAAPRDLTLAQDGSVGPKRFDFGRYEVYISKRGFHPRTLSIEVRVGERTTVDANLVEMDGRLTLTSDPSGAEVYLGKTLLGRTPLEGVTIGPGHSRVRLEHPERDPLTLPRVVEVRGDRDVDLGTVALPPLAVLDLTALGEGVTATLDGEVVSGELRRRSGTVTLRLDREKHRHQTVEVALESGKTTRPTVRDWILKPGWIDLTKLPEKTDVLLDGRLVEDLSAPLTGEAGSHRVEIYRANHRPLRFETTVEPEATAKLPELKWNRKWYRPAVADLDPPPDQGLSRTRLPVGVVLHERRVHWEKDAAEMVIVPAGAFEPGRHGQGETRSRPVSVSAFLMDRHEVTNEQFAAFIKETGYVTHAERTRRYTTWRERVRTDDRLPVVNVNHRDAREYAKWAGKRLPTEAEFEWALRGGHEDRIYPWGNAPPTGDPVGNYSDRARKRKTPRASVVENYDDRFPSRAPVGSFPANEFGLFDISGNLWEWVHDWHAPYPEPLPEDPTAPLANPKGPLTGAKRLVRGGGWDSHLGQLRCANRGMVDPNMSSISAGFRCVVDLPR